MQQCSEPARAKAGGEQEADENDDRNLQSHHPAQRRGHEENRDERPEKNRGLGAAENPEHDSAIVERSADIFREARPCLGKRTIHPHRGKLQGVAVEKPLSLRDQFGNLPAQRHVLDDMRAHAFMPADAFIRAPRKEHELSVCDAHAAHIMPPRPLGLFLNPSLQPQRAKCETHEQDHWHDQFFAGRHRHEPRPRGDEARAIPLRIRDCGGHGARCVFGIGIGEKQKLAARRLRELMARPIFSRPPVWQRLTANQPCVHTRAFARRIGDQPLHDRAGVVLGMIVQHDHLAVRVILPQQRTHARRDAPLLVPRRDENGNQRRIFRRLGGTQPVE